jgi:hypothetical protein
MKIWHEVSRDLHNDEIAGEPGGDIKAEIPPKRDGYAQNDDMNP